MKTLPKIALCSLAAASAVCSLASSNDKQQIRMLYTKLKNAMMTKNIAAIEKMESPDFTETEMGRTLNAKQANDSMKMQFRMIKQTKYINMDITSMKIEGKNAHVTTKFAMEAVMMGQDSKDHTLKVTGTTVEMLVKTANGWLFKSEKDTGSKVVMDGKPVKM